MWEIDNIIMVSVPGGLFNLSCEISKCMVPSLLLLPMVSILRLSTVRSES